MRKITKERIIYIILVALCLILGVNIGRTVFKIQNSSQILEKAQSELDGRKDEHENLNREIAKAESREYIESQIREKLSLTREGEIMVILPSIEVRKDITPTPSPSFSNLEKWVREFVR